MVCIELRIAHCTLGRGRQRAAGGSQRGSGTFALGSHTHTRAHIIHAQHTLTSQDINGFYFKRLTARKPELKAELEEFKTSLLASMAKVDETKVTHMQDTHTHSHA